jgi:hypothetical protein
VNGFLNPNQSKRFFAIDKIGSGLENLDSHLGGGSKTALSPTSIANPKKTSSSTSRLKFQKNFQVDPH